MSSHIYISKNEAAKCEFASSNSSKISSTETVVLPPLSVTM